MPKLSHLKLRKAVIDAANLLVRTGAISMSHHGNFSARIPGTDTMLLTATSSFDSLKPKNLAILDLDGHLLDGDMSPTAAEIVHMHAVVYKHRPDMGAVVHTHSPYATSFALANRPITCAYEALVRSEMTDGVPLAFYGPRGIFALHCQHRRRAGRRAAHQGGHPRQPWRTGLWSRFQRRGPEQPHCRGSSPDGYHGRIAGRRQRHPPRAVTGQPRAT